MKHRGWFTLVVRATGLFLMVMYAPFLAFVVKAVVEDILGRIGAVERLAPPSVLSLLLSVLPSLVPLAAGVYLFFRGGWVIERCLREAEAIEAEAAGHAS